MDIKELIAKNIDYQNAEIDFKSLITENADKNMGDYSIACFALAKVLRKSPVLIATEIKDKIHILNLI